jgi:hypothetical protein
VKHATVELFEIAYRFHPRGLWPSDPRYPDTAEEHRLVDAHRRPGAAGGRPGARTGRGPRESRAGGGHAPRRPVLRRPGVCGGEARMTARARSDVLLPDPRRRRAETAGSRTRTRTSTRTTRQDEGRRTKDEGRRTKDEGRTQGQPALLGQRRRQIRELRRDAAAGPVVGRLLLLVGDGRLPPLRVASPGRLLGGPARPAGRPETLDAARRGWRAGRGARSRRGAPNLRGCG